jgi:hypothetical protein
VNPATNVEDSGAARIGGGWHSYRVQ